MDDDNLNMCDDVVIVCGCIHDEASVVLPSSIELELGFYSKLLLTDYQTIFWFL